MHPWLFTWGAQHYNDQVLYTTISKKAGSLTLWLLKRASDCEWISTCGLTFWLAKLIHPKLSIIELTWCINITMSGPKTIHTVFSQWTRGLSTRYYSLVISYWGSFFLWRAELSSCRNLSCIGEFEAGFLFICVIRIGVGSTGEMSGLIDSITLTSCTSS